MLDFHYSGTNQPLRGRALTHRLMALGLFFSLCLAPAYAQTIRWNCDVDSGLWDAPESWVSRPPRPGDNVIIDCPGRDVVVTLRTPEAINSLQNNATLEWLDGSLGVANGFTNAGSLVLPWDGCASDLSFRGLLVNTGTIVENMPCSLDISSATLDNRGVYELKEGGIVGNGTFNNRSTLRKSGTGTAWLEDLLSFNNSNGRVEVLEGTLNIFGGTSSGNGTYAVASGSSLVYGYHTFTGTHGGLINGSLRFQLGTLGIGSGGATFNFTGNGFQWLGGEVNGGRDGLRNIGLLRLEPSPCRSGLSLRGTLVNTGTIRENMPCPLDISSATLDNRGMYELRAGNIEGSGMFKNTGTLRKFNFESTPEISATLDNTGTVEMVEGTLKISGPITQLSDNTLTGGTWKVTDDTTLDIISDSDIMINNANILLLGTTYGFPKINNLVTNNGTFTLEVGTFTAVDSFTNTGNLKVDRNGSFVVGGTNKDYIQTSGSTSLNGVLQASGNVLIKGGRLAGNGAVVAQMFSNAGEIGTGNSDRVSIQVQGDYVQTSTGKLQIKIAGRQEREFDQLSVGNVANLDGTLDIKLINGFRPRLGDRFKIMTYGVLMREFRMITGRDLGGGLVFCPQYDDNSLTLVVDQQCERP